MKKVIKELQGPEQNRISAITEDAFSITIKVVAIDGIISEPVIDKRDFTTGVNLIKVELSNLVSSIEVAVVKGVVVILYKDADLQSDVDEPNEEMVVDDILQVTALNKADQNRKETENYNTDLTMKAINIGASKSRWSYFK